MYLYIIILVLYYIVLFKDCFDWSDMLTGRSDRRPFNIFVIFVIVLTFYIMAEFLLYENRIFTEP